MPVEKTITDIFGKTLHQKRQASLSNTAFGLLKSESLFLHAMGEGLASFNGGDKKHATKQIDRMLSNEGFCIWTMCSKWIPYVIGKQKIIRVSLDWTSFAKDGQWTICLNLLTSQGSSTPLLWHTIKQSQLKNNRARFEDQLLTRLKEALPADVQVLLVADRGFADRRFFDFLDKTLGFFYIIRIKLNTVVINDKNESKKAKEWLRTDGRVKGLMNVKITHDAYEVKQFVSVHDRGMKSAWFLATNMPDMKAREIVNWYGKRWKIEPYFRDMKDGTYGLGLRSTHIKASARKDRLLFVVALCYLLLILLGASGERVGLDKLLKVNTVKTRTHSLFRQGQFYWKFFPNWSQERRDKLLNSFNDFLNDSDFWLNFLPDIQ